MDPFGAWNHRPLSGPDRSEAVSGWYAARGPLSVELNISDPEWTDARESGRQFVISVPCGDPPRNLITVTRTTCSGQAGNRTFQPGITADSNTGTELPGVMGKSPPPGSRRGRRVTRRWSQCDRPRTATHKAPACLADAIPIPAFRCVVPQLRPGGSIDRKPAATVAGCLTNHTKRTDQSTQFQPRIGSRPINVVFRPKHDSAGAGVDQRKPPSISATGS